MKIVFRSVIIAFIACVILNMLSFSATCDSIREKVLRLHVVANSDSGEDQALKLAVRDKVLEKGDEIFAGDKGGKEQLLKIARESLGEIEGVALGEIGAQGFDYPVKAEVCRMYFATRDYGGLTLPAGMYDAVRVVIGEGKGENWWCVMFPPLCLPSSCENREQMLEDVLTGTEKKVVTNGTRYKLKFKIVEIFQSMFARGKG